MKKILLMVLCSTCSLFAGCEQTDELGVTGEDLRMSVVASIGDVDDLSSGRYAGDTPNEAAFADGDAIGMAVGEGTFVKWKYDGSDWNPDGNAIYWKDRTTEYNFYAFYPYVENAMLTSVPMPSLAAQDGTMESVSECDFLIAKTKQSFGDDGTVAFTGNNAFSHVSSLVVLVLNGGGDLTSATLDKITLSGTNLITSSTYSFQDGSVHLSDTKTDDLNVVFTNHAISSNGETFYLLLNAATIELSQVTLSIHYTVNGVKYKAEKTGINKEADDKFLGGYQYSYNISIVDNTLKISGNTIKPWESGTSLGDITLEGEKDETQS